MLKPWLHSQIVLDSLPKLILGRLTVVLIPAPVWRWHCLIAFQRQARGLKN